jgi:GT2 family glycosyltransferase
LECANVLEELKPQADTVLPSLSVVIPTGRGGADLERCLSSIHAQRYPDLEVIVVDNGSPDDAVGELPSDIRVIRNEENLGFVGASNQGIEASTGELVLLLNDDAALEPGALVALAGALAGKPSWGACQAKLLLMEDPRRLDTAGSFLTVTGFLVHRGAFEPEERFTASDEIFAAKGAALLIRRQALLDVGAFDPDFFAYFEETDLCWRLWLAGWEVGFAADARVLHKLGATASGLPAAFVQFHSFKNRICTLLKNLGAARLVWMLPYHLALCLCLAGWFALRGRAGIAAAIVRAMLWNAIHLPRTLGRRREIQRHRRVTDRTLMPRITRPTPTRTLFGYATRGVRSRDSAR